MRALLALAFVALTGCEHLRLFPENTWQEVGKGVVMTDPGDTRYLLDAKPETVTAAMLRAHADALEAAYVRDVAVEGVVWQPVRSAASIDEPDRYGGGGDSLLFTGVALAGWAWKYRATNDPADLARVEDALRGLWVLTHIAGNGVLARCAFPSGREAEWGYPDAWAGRLSGGFVGETVAGVVPDPLMGASATLPAMRWYTRGTKDQLTGVMFGLAVVWKLIDDPRLKAVAKQMTINVYAHLRKHDWRIRDARGKNDTSADDVDDLLRIAVLGLARAVGIEGAEAEYLAEFERYVGVMGILGVGDRYNNLEQYFAHNLRAMRAFSVWLLDDDEARDSVMVRYYEKHVRAWTAGHQNAWLAWLWAAMSGDTDARADGLASMRSLALKPRRLWSSPLAGVWKAPGFLAVTLGTTARWALPPHLRKGTAYSTWQKEPWDTGDLPHDHDGLDETTGVDFLAAHALGAYYGFIAD
jgi:hypothetical protein